MTGLDVFTFVVIAVLIAAGFGIAFVLGALPGKIAAERGHPQAEAVRVAGWLGLLMLGLLWPFALIWAYLSPSTAVDSSELRLEVDLLVERIGALEARDTAQHGGGSRT